MPQARDEAGNLWDVTDPDNPVLVQAASAGRIIPAPVDPYEGPKAAADLANTRDLIDSRRRDDERADRTEARQEKSEERQLAMANASLYKEGLMIGPDGVTPVPIPGWRPPLTGAQQEDRTNRVARLDQLAAQIKRVQQLYDAGPGATTGAWALSDYLPTDANARFDTAGASLSQQGLAAFRVPGTGTISDRDAMMFDRANLPEAGKRDVANEEILLGLRTRVDEERAALGLPPVNWTEQKDDTSAGVNQPGGGGRSVWDAPVPSAGPAQTVATGRTALRSDTRMNALVNSMMNAGAPLAQINAELRKAGRDYAEISPAQYTAVRKWMRENPGQRYNGANVTYSEDLSLLERAAASPVGTAALSAADAGSFGLTDEAAGLINSVRNGTSYTEERDRAQAAKEASKAVNPTANTVGTIIGGVTGGAALSTGAASAGARLLSPSQMQRAAAVLQGARGAALEGGAYGALYGAGTSNNDRLGGVLTGALAGAGGGVLGYGAVKGVGSAVGGVRDAATRAMVDRGITLTPGQMLRNSGSVGRTINRMEEAAESLPGLNALIRQRREDSFADFNRAGFDEALAPINATVSNIGEEGIEEASDAVRAGFARALDGVEVAPDEPFFDAIAQAGAKVAPDNPYAADFRQIVSDDLAPVLAGKSALSGQDLQDLLRVAQAYGRQYRKLGTTGTAEGPKPFARPVAGAFDGLSDALESLVQRQSPGTLPKYNAAKEAYRRLQVMRDAVDRAAVGTQSGAGGVATPAQVIAAARKNAKAFGGAQGTTRQPFFELSRAAQEVLPQTLPNSGTFDRGIANAVVATPVLGSAIAAQQGWIDPSTAAAITGAALLYSKGGSKAAAKALGQRSAKARQLGDRISASARRRGLFGAPLGVTLAIEPPR